MPFLLVAFAPGSLNHIANIVKGYAIAIGVAFAVWVVWQWWRNRAREMAEGRAAQARAVYARHLAVALNNPELAEPMLGSQASAIEAARYRLFVAGLLAAADEILALDPSEAWRGTLYRSLVAHRSYLSSSEFEAGPIADCSPALRGIVQSVVSAR